MDEKFIMMFAQEYLALGGTVNEYELRNFIASRPEVEKIISIDEIRTALDNAYSRGELDIVYADNEIGVYRKGK